jgi:hypothetical protein
MAGSKASSAEAELREHEKVVTRNAFGPSSKTRRAE